MLMSIEVSWREKVHQWKKDPKDMLIQILEAIWLSGITPDDDVHICFGNGHVVLTTDINNEDIMNLLEEKAKEDE